MQKFRDAVLATTDRPAGALRPVSGASVTVKNLDGTTPTLYSDDGVTALASNVLTTDSSGEYSFYAPNGHYQLTIASSTVGSESVSDIVLFDPDDASGTIATAYPFLAKGDGTTDDTAAFNRISAAIRAAIVALDYSQLPIKVVIPPGRYSISSWDLTEIRSRRVEIHMHGAILVARTAGKHVIDLLGSRFVSLHGGVIYSASTVVAKSAIQLGPVGTETSGNNAIYDLMAIGYYSQAPLMNLGSETTTYWGCTFLNRNTSASVYAAIFDGLTQFLPTSDYATVTRISGDALSFSNNKAYGCQWRNEGGGSACWGGKMEGFTFDRGNYYLSFNDSAWVIYSNAFRNKGLSINGQFENSQNDNPTVGNIGIRYGFTFDNNGTNTAIDGFECDAFGPQCETFFMRNIGSGTLRISNAKLRVMSLAQSGALFFGTTGSIAIDGMIETAAANRLNLGVLTSFNGVAFVDDRSALVSVPAAGTHVIYSRSDSSAYSAGLFLPLGSPQTFTPTVTFATPGDLSVAYSVQVGNYVPLAGGAVYVQVFLTFTPTYTTASGEFRISGFPSSLQSLAATSTDQSFSITSINSQFTWPASATMVTARLPNNSTNFRLYGHGNGIASAAFTTANVPSGTSKTLAFSGIMVPKAQ